MEIFYPTSSINGAHQVLGGDECPPQLPKLMPQLWKCVQETYLNRQRNQNPPLLVKQSFKWATI